MFATINIITFLKKIGNDFKLLIFSLIQYIDKFRSYWSYLCGPHRESRMVYSLGVRSRSSRICTLITLYNIIWVMKVHYFDI